jgi:hypothetical protein
MDRTFRRAFRSYLSEVETTRGSTDLNEINSSSERMKAPAGKRRLAR